MNNRSHLEASLQKLETEFGAGAIYDFFSGFHDVVVKGHSSEEEDNPHDATEQPAHILYHLGARAAESLRAQLKES